MSRARRALVAGVVSVVAVVPAGVGPPGEPRPEPPTGPESAAVLEVRAIGPHGTQLATGVVVGDGLVLTVAHALGDATAIRVGSRPACAVVVDRARDAAVLGVGGLAGTPVGLAVTAAPGDAWLARPNLDAASGPAAPADVSPAGIRRRIVARVHEPLDAAIHERAALELATTVTAGDSGAPVLDADGRLMGLVFATSRRHADTSYGVAVDELAPLVEAAGTGWCR